MSSSSYESPWLDDETRMFRVAVRQFIEKEFVPNHARWCEQHRPDAEAWKKAGEIGMLLPDVPEPYGGGGGTFAHEAVVTEELARAGVNFGSGVQSTVAHYILGFGSEEQKRRWLPRMASGELVGAIAMTEPDAGSDLQAVKTSARRDGDHYVIDGSKTFITNGWHAGLVCLAARTDPAASGPRALSLIIVETRDLPGYRVGGSLQKLGRHAQDTCEIFFDGVRVPVANLLGPAEGRGLFQMMEQLSYERLSVGLAGVAVAERAVALTTKYVKERTAYGKPLLDLQAVRFSLAECRTEAHVGRVFIDSCIERFIDRRLDAATAAMAKYWLTDCECRIVDKCLQLHGGYGYSEEYPIARMWADSRVQRIYAGANEVMKEIVGWSL
jgi:acyl-CoA dehydrogenase